MLAGVAPTLQVAVDALIPFHLLRHSRRRRKTSGNLGECVLRIALCDAEMADEVVQTWRGFHLVLGALAVVVRSRCCRMDVPHPLRYLRIADLLLLIVADILHQLDAMGWMLCCLI